MKYKQPTVGDNKVVYKGKRYWVIELSGKQEIEGFGSDFCQYIMYDKLYEGILATIKKNDKGNQYLSLGTNKDKYMPVNVELVVKDLTGKVLATVANPKLTVQNPRKRPGITEDQLSKIPDFILADVSLAPSKEV